jgi:hypothetical protein
LAIDTVRRLGGPTAEDMLTASRAFVSATADPGKKLNAGVNFFTEQQRRRQVLERGRAWLQRVGKLEAYERRLDEIRAEGRRGWREAVDQVVREFFP